MHATFRNVKRNPFLSSLKYDRYLKVKWMSFNRKTGLNEIIDNKNKPPTPTSSNQLVMTDLKKRIALLMDVEKGFRMVHPKRNHLLPMLPDSQDDLPKRSMRDSYESAIIPLGTELSLQDRYSNMFGTARIGRLLEDMDMFAVWVSLKFLKNPKETQNKPTPYVIVTALVDNISLVGECKATSDVKIHGMVTWAGSSSMEICVWLEQNVSGAWKQFMKAYFIMAARNSTNTGKAFVNKLVPDGEEELKKFEKAQGRMANRKKDKEVSLLKRIPDKEEQKLIHELFTNSVDPKDPSLNKRILPLNTVWMNSTKLSTVVFPHPEDKNHHNTVFGGIIMRLAIELGWMVGYLHCKTRPKLRNISDITFRRPISVGDLLQMSGLVVYTDKNFMHVMVQAELHDIKKGTNIITNTFNLTYELPHEVTKVIPLTYHDAMMFTDGRRHFLKGIDTEDVKKFDSHS